MKTPRSKASACVQSRSRVSAPRSAQPLLVVPRNASWKTLQNARGQFLRSWSHVSGLFSRAWMNVRTKSSRAWKCIRERQAVHASNKRLQVAATVSLGEKRFAAVLRVDGQEFLVGGGATNVALLAQLPAKESFDGVLTAMTVPEKQPVTRTAKPAVEPMREQA